MALFEDPSTILEAFCHVFKILFDPDEYSNGSEGSFRIFADFWDIFSRVLPRFSKDSVMSLRSCSILMSYLMTLKDFSGSFRIFADLCCIFRTNLALFEDPSSLQSLLQPCERSLQDFLVQVSVIECRSCDPVGCSHRPLTVEPQLRSNKATPQRQRRPMLRHWTVLSAAKPQPRPRLHNCLNRSTLCLWLQQINLHIQPLDIDN